MWRMWLTALMWGFNWTAVKILLTGASPWTLRAAGLAGGALLLAVFTRASGQSFAIPRSAWHHVIIAGILNVACFNLFAAFAQLAMPASRAAILTFTMPFWATLFSWIILNDRVDRLRAIALSIGACGILILCSSFWPQIAQGFLPVGLVYVMAAAICWAAGTVYLKVYRIEAAPLALATWQVTVAAIAVTMGMIVFETPRLDLSEPRLMAAFVYHVIFPQAFAYVLWFGLIQRVSAATASIGTLLVPVVGVIGAMVFLGERPSGADYVGFLLLFIAVQTDQMLRTKPAAP
jgi:drug/metabolite transporter (DMT)-like permease